MREMPKWPKRPVNSFYDEDMSGYQEEMCAYGWLLAEAALKRLEVLHEKASVLCPPEGVAVSMDSLLTMLNDLREALAAIGPLPNVGEGRK